MRYQKTSLAAALVCVLMTACSPGDSTPQSPLASDSAGITSIPGGPTEPTPVAPSSTIPTRHQEAQDTVLRYLQDTVNELPPGSSLDGTRYVAGGDTRFCDDDPSGADAPVRFSDWRDIQMPSRDDYNQVVLDVGDIWKSWGWQVIERDGYDKPNRFGYAPDGYVLQVTASYPPTYPPSVIGTSPCFPGNLRADIARNPPAINQGAQR